MIIHKKGSDYIAVSTWMDDRNNTYSEPYIPEKIVGFHGIDTDLISAGGNGGGTATGTDDHEQLRNLLGGDFTGHWQINEFQYGTLYNLELLRSHNAFPILEALLEELYSQDANGYFIKDSNYKSKLTDLIDARIAAYNANNP